MLETATTQTIHPIIEKIFHKRQLSKSDLNDYLSWDLKKLPDLTQLKDIQKGSKRIIEALKKGEKIGGYGDYDVDGTTGLALFHHFFNMLGYSITLFQPSRLVEGYGLHPSAIDEALKNDITVMISVDCGITSIQTADYSREKKVDLIITDHHHPGENLPNAYAVINPNRDEEDNSPLRVLAGVGVAFALCWQIKKDWEAQGGICPSLYPLLSWVAIGTICDVAAMTPINLKLVRHGWSQIRQSKLPGLMALFKPEERELFDVPTEKFSFGVGPLINSQGRITHPEKALHLLTANTLEYAYECLHLLEISNKERKLLQAQVVKEAIQKVIQETNLADPVINIVYSPEWHEGVIGIVASRLVETFQIPAIVMTNSNQEGVLKASVRSAGTLDIFSCLSGCSDLFIKFGGHKAAAGFSLSLANLSEFSNRMNKILRKIPAALRRELDSFDLQIHLEEISP
ncbi:MAG: single-stranded-DNA-specific exonuclease RecJ, partial [Pseudomonadota bacterium]